VNLYNRIVMAAAAIAGDVRKSPTETVTTPSEMPWTAPLQPVGARGLDIRYKPVPAFPDRRSYRAVAREKRRRRNVAKRVSKR